jgi:hypothetical protein
VLALLVLVVFALSVVEQPAKAAATARTNASAKLRRIFVSPLFVVNAYFERP